MDMKISLPVADGTVKISGEDQDLRRSTLTRRAQTEGKNKIIFEENQTGLLQHQARNDFWSISGNFIYRHHVEPRVKLYVPTEESFLVPLKYIEVTRTTDTTLDVMSEKRIEDYWNVDGDKELSDAWTGFTRFMKLNERPLDGCTWSGVRLTRKQPTSRPDIGMARYVEAYVWCIEEQREAKMSHREAKTRKCQKITWYFLYWTWWWRIQAYHEKCS